MATGETLVDVARERAATLGEALCVRYLVNGEATGPSVDLSYAALVRRASAIAATLQQHVRPDDRALLMFPAGVEFVTAFFGCLFAGVVPVPVYPPDFARPERALAKLRAIVVDSGAGVALTTQAFLPSLDRAKPAIPELAHIAGIAVDVCDDANAGDWRPTPITGDTIALLQYTSGSTGSPKGAVIRHRQLIANERTIAAKMGPVKLVAGWLPVFHDMGLIGNVLQVIYAGAGLVMMSPFSFLKRPARWLEAISHFRADTSGGPNFAYEQCVRRVSDEERARLDLSCWELAFCGAEPVRTATVDRFCEMFAPRGFARRAFYPCYGLAEATLFVTGGTRGTEARHTTFRASALDRGEAIATSTADDARALVSCGTPSSTEEIRIVDPDTAAPLADGRVGEIWVRGPAISNGYYNRGDNSAVFAAQLASGESPFLRTGDLGFLHEGELYISGRRKDMVIIGGRNLFPTDIEATAEAAVPTIRKGCCAAFSIERDGEEKLVLVAEHDVAKAVDVIREIKRAVAEHHQVALHDVVLVTAGTLPKTSSGKLERYACRAAYLSGAYLIS
ncbi:MAG TPA: fatty acyl-AMP ligase [Kofleriaceae bacterium]|nr:fatty acyl-AMP ligase [Kofleriaceae bacterium]